MKRFDKNQLQVITVYSKNGEIVGGSEWDTLKIGSRSRRGIT